LFRPEASISGASPGAIRYDHRRRNHMRVIPMMMLGIGALCTTPAEAEFRKVQVVECIGTLINVPSTGGRLRAPLSSSAPSSESGSADAVLGLPVGS
jgi:hypothetical protein